MERLGAAFGFSGAFFFSPKNADFHLGLCKATGRKSRLDVPVDDSIESGRIDPVGRMKCDQLAEMGMQPIS